MVLLVVVACGGGDDAGGGTTAASAATSSAVTTTIPAADTTAPMASAQTVTSDDGRATLQIPDGAIPGDVTVTIRAVDTVDLDGVENDLVLGAAYELLPDGLGFAEPARFEVRVEAPASGPEFPVYLTALVSSDGTVETLTGSTVTVDGGDVVISSEIEHFTDYVAVVAESFRLDPSEVTREVGDGWDSEIRFRSRQGNWSASNLLWATGDTAVAVVTGSADRGASFECVGPGATTFSVFGDLSVVTVLVNTETEKLDPLAVVILGVIGRGQDTSRVEVETESRYDAATLTGNVTCTPAVPDPIQVPVGDDTLEYDGPVTAPPGGMLEGSVCVPGLNGVPWFMTLGEPPSAPEATHTSGTLDGDGCMDFILDVNWPDGATTSLYTSDGENVWKVTDVEVGDFSG